MKQFEPLPGEEVLREETIHWKNYIIPALFLAASFAACNLRMAHMDFSIANRLLHAEVIPAAAGRTVAIAETVFLMYLMLMSFLKMMRVYYTKYYLTNMRVISTSGIINRYYNEILVERLEMVYLKQNAYERLYNCGDIVCVSAGANLLLDDVRNAVAFRQQVMMLILERRGNR